ncbi:histidinol dehydrogenase [Lysobacter claricitrinus]|uniref:histidinol dehydrogenase n=1 Tax=Lysobacter claricitrinus TaxID=3367728 RepID=UPI0037DBE5AB
MKRVRWSDLDAVAREAFLRRPSQRVAEDVTSSVAALIAQVRRDGDLALRALTARFDGVEIDRFEVDAQAFSDAAAALPEALKRAIDDAADRIRTFHAACTTQPVAIDTAPGVRCERVLRPIRRVGLYVPAGSAPLPSTALMLGVPAQLAGCVDIVLCSPPRPDGTVDPAVLYAAQRCGIRRVFAVGGVQAIAAMAFGTASVPKCDKLFGPGNGFVTEAKRQVSMAEGGAAIDMPAGPSEVLVIADRGCTPAFVAADLLSQAEHGRDSQVILVSDDATVIDEVAVAIDQQLDSLSRADIARAALAASLAIRVETLDAAFDVSNAYAPEHLILAVREPRRWLNRVEAAGSIFLGDWAPEALGDYCSGTNHVLPTGGAARSTGGLSVASFQVAITVQEVARAGLAAIGPCAVELAMAEGLDAHRRAVSVRLEALA